MKKKQIPYAMTNTRISRLLLPSCFRVCFLVCISIVVSGSPAAANPVEPVSFTWQANPPEDYVLGYKLYYGPESRFDASGSPKTDFSYEYYIDFASFERCVAGSSNTVCEILVQDEVECEDLSGNFPSCTLHDLQGGLYFSLTAYNSYAESDYTSELSMSPGGNSVGPIINIINTILLLKRNNS